MFFIAYFTYDYRFINFMFNILNNGLATLIDHKINHIKLALLYSSACNFNITQSNFSGFVFSLVEYHSMHNVSSGIIIKSVTF